MPRVLARLPYGQDFKRVTEFNFEEEVDGKEHNNYLWMGAAWAYAARITDAFAQYGWMARTRGVEGGGKVEGLPVHTFPTDDGDVAMKCPTEIAISDRREFELSNLGFLPLLHSKGSDFAVFMGAQSCQKPKTYFDPAANANAELSAKFNLLLCTSRFAHYLKVMARDKIGSFMEVGECGDLAQRLDPELRRGQPRERRRGRQGPEAARRMPGSRSGRSRASRATTRRSPISGRTSSSRRSRPRCDWSPRSPRGPESRGPGSGRRRATLDPPARYRSHLRERHPGDPRAGPTAVAGRVGPTLGRRPSAERIRDLMTAPWRRGSQASFAFGSVSFPIRRGVHEPWRLILT